MRDDTAFLMVYMTAADREEAHRIASVLVEERLAACANILGSIESIYHWKGTIERDAEVAFTAKTTAVRFDALAERVRSLHSYETPCIVALPFARGDAAFLDWIEEHTRSGR